MAEKTKISWADATFNPWRGCVKVSPGCQFCYAERESGRNPAVLGVWGPRGTRVLAAQHYWNMAEKLDRYSQKAGVPRLVFMASLADLFEKWDGQMTDHLTRPLWRNYPAGSYDHPSEVRGPASGPYTLGHARARVWQTVRATPHLIWLILTKRPENVPAMMPDGAWPNVWLGTSVESQDYVPRIDRLLECGRDVGGYFVSAEPLLGHLDLTGCLTGPDHPGPRVGWVIVGGESGARDKARPFNLFWARSLYEQCAAAGTAYFLKQLGDRPVRTSARAVEDYPAGPGGKDVTLWPLDMRIQEFPDEFRRSGAVSIAD
jgi:protein gp37